MKQQNQENIRFLSCYLSSLTNFFSETVRISQITHCLYSLFAEHWVLEGDSLSY